jgi:hypothetical protein
MRSSTTYNTVTIHLALLGTTEASPSPLISLLLRFIRFLHKPCHYSLLLLPSLLHTLVNHNSTYSLHNHFLSLSLSLNLSLINWFNSLGSAASMVSKPTDSPLLLHQVSFSPFPLSIQFSYRNAIHNFIIYYIKYYTNSVFMYGFLIILYLQIFSIILYQY